MSTTSHYFIPAKGQSKVSHKLRLSQQEKANRLTTLAPFVACLTGLLLLVNLVSPSKEQRDHSVSASMLAELLPASWAYYSPYHPAAKFEGSTREGCFVSQVNIVSSASRDSRSF